MLPATPLRRILTPLLLGAGALSLYLTRPQVPPNLESGQTKTAACLANLSQIGRAYSLYARDFDGKIPLAVDPEDRYNSQIWRGPENEDYAPLLQDAPFLHVVLRPYVDSPQVFQCPADIGWTTSRFSYQGLTNVLPTSFAKFGTSYYSWTKYGFDLKTFADIPNPASRTLLFDGDLWHGSGTRERAGALFADGHAGLVSRETHRAFAPPEDE